MKKAMKFGLFVMSALLVASMCFACAAKPPKDKTLAFFTPMGAPALGLAKMMRDKPVIEADGITYRTDYTVVDSADIASKVITSAADVILLPVNAAATLLCDANGNYADKYKIVSVVTHGNLYLLRKSANTVKKVGVMNLAAVPGLTYKTVLGAGNYTENASEAAVEKPYLKEIGSVAPPAVISQADVDAIVVPEPAATAVMSAKGEALGLVKESLQEAAVWGSAKGYAQAVIAVKKNLTTAAFVNAMLTQVERSIAWMKEETNGVLANAAAIESAVSDARASAGITMTFNASNLLVGTIQGCNIYVEKGATVALSVAAFLSAVRTVAPQSPSFNPEIVF